MKHRKGFVSNSSSDSFLLVSTKSAEQFKEWLQKVYTVVEEVDDNIDNILTIYEIDKKGAEAFNKEITDYSSLRRNGNYINNIIEASGETGHKIIRVDSTQDNSIPWSIQELLEKKGAFRQHWG
jgi:hypothetical protein